MDGELEDRLVSIEESLNNTIGYSEMNDFLEEAKKELQSDYESQIRQLDEDLTQAIEQIMERLKAIEERLDASKSS